MKSLLARARSAAALARRGDIDAIYRRARANVAGAAPLLPEDLAPRPRPPGAARPRAVPSRPLLLAVSPGLSRTGAPLSQFELVEGLAAREWDVHVISMTAGPVEARYLEAGIRCDLEPALAASPAVPQDYERDVERIAAFLSARGPDLVYANTIDLFPVIDAARIAGVPSIWNIRESGPWRARLSDRHKDIAARALAAFSYPAAVIFVAAASRAAWSPFVAPERARVIHNAAAAPVPSLSDDERRDLRRQLGLGEDRRVLLCVGALCERKGQIDVAEAYSALPAALRATTQLVFLGEGEAAYVRRVREALSREAAVSTLFAGDVDNPQDYLAAASVLLNASRAEAFPRVFLEAAAHGVPIIATPVDGAAERLSDGRSALFFEPGDCAKLSALIATLLNDRALAGRLACGARTALIDGWTFDAMIDAYDDAFRVALRAGPA